MNKSLFFSLVLICCTTPKTEKIIYSIETVQKEIIGHSINELSEINFSFNAKRLSVKDTTLEDEGESWRGLNYYYDDNLLFAAETSWNNRDTIVRVNTGNYLLKTSKGLSAGESFQSIKPYIAFESWKDFPDGYVAFKDRSDSRIIFVMNTEEHLHLLEGALKVDKIPSSLKVQNIVIVR